MLKLCSKCNREYPNTTEYFYKHPKMKDRLTSWCKNCYNNWHKNWYKENPEKIRNYQVKCLYGITSEKYNQMLENQNHCCGICGRHKDEFKRKLDIDHDHKTGKIRGLLCSHCNRGMGYLKHNTLILARCIKYLKINRITI